MIVNGSTIMWWYVEAVMTITISAVIDVEAYSISMITDEIICVMVVGMRCKMRMIELSLRIE